MKPSTFDGQSVLHIDGAKNVHSGVIVGQSDDDQTLYVQSDRHVDNSKSAWDFAISASLAPVLIANAKAQR